jgi:hypothetical protein
MPTYNPLLISSEKIPKAADEAERSLVARKFIAAAHIDGMPRDCSAPSLRYGTARSIIQKTLPAPATHVARKSFLHCKISFPRRSTTTYVAGLPRAR